MIRVPLVITQILIYTFTPQFIKLKSMAGESSQDWRREVELLGEHKEGSDGCMYYAPDLSQYLKDIAANINAAAHVNSKGSEAATVIPLFSPEKTYALKIEQAIQAVRLSDTTLEEIKRHNRVASDQEKILKTPRHKRPIFMPESDGAPRHFSFVANRVTNEKYTLQHSPEKIDQLLRILARRLVKAFVKHDNVGFLDNGPGQINTGILDFIRKPFERHAGIFKDFQNGKAHTGIFGNFIAMIALGRYHHGADLLLLFHEIEAGIDRVAIGNSVPVYNYGELDAFFLNEVVLPERSRYPIECLRLEETLRQPKRRFAEIIPYPGEQPLAHYGNGIIFVNEARGYEVSERSKM